MSCSHHDDKNLGKRERYSVPFFCMSCTGEEAVVGEPTPMYSGKLGTEGVIWREGNAVG